MLSMRDYLHHLRQLNDAAFPREIVDVGALGLRLSEIAALGRSLRIRSRLLGEEILVVPDDEAKAAASHDVSVYTVTEMRELLTVAESPEMFRTLHRVKKAFGPLDLLDLGLDPRPDLPDHDLWTRALAIASAEGDRELSGFLDAIRAAGTEVTGQPGSWALVLPDSEWDAAKQRSVREQWIEPLWPRIAGLFDQATRSGTLRRYPRLTHLC
jgi:hypothetical protein